MEHQRRDSIFRVFVSSTFSDFVHERNVLQEKVFPALREYCQEKGARFQAIDLRWGVSREAGLGHQTMNICLQEIHRCQKLSPRPNFIVLLGNRYGWRPVPLQIEAKEFEQLLEILTEGEQKQLKTWYRQDENAVPPEYVLLPRKLEYRKDPPADRQNMYRQQDANEWLRTEQELRNLLLKAVEQVFSANDPKRRKYVDSATHQEIRLGVIEAERPQEHVFCYFRELKGLPAEETAARYCDIKAGEKDTEAEGRLSALKTELSGILSEKNIRRYEAEWQDNKPNYNLEKLCEDIKEDLIGVIDQELRDFYQRPMLERAREDYREFAEERCRHFIGRADQLKRISDYIESSEGDQPLIIHSKSGFGKTALIAKAWLDVVKRRSAIVRFIGATPDSCDLHSLLTTLCRELGVEGPPQDMKELVSTFQERLSSSEKREPRRLTKESRKALTSENTVIFLDALDQLNAAENARTLYWLPRKLIPGVKLVMSVRETESKEGKNLGDKNPFEMVRRIWPDSLEELGVFGEKEGKQLLELWLAESGRDLQEVQQMDVLEKFSTSGSPLYLKLAFEEARCWKSWEGLLFRSDNMPGLNNDVFGILEDFFWRLEMPKNHGRVLVEHTLGYIAAARNGLTEDELIDILSADRDVMDDFLRRSPDSPKLERLPAVVWSRLFDDIEHYMTRRRADGTIVMDFYHTQVGEAVERRYLQDDNRLKKHINLANYFAGLDYWAESLEQQRERARRLPPSPRPANIRKIVELPYHRIEAAKLGGQKEPTSPLWDAVAELLTDWRFLEAKAEADPSNSYVAHQTTFVDMAGEEKS